ncbi:MAG: hypothetical protein ACOCV1_07985 [Bacillota bacterium]
MKTLNKITLDNADMVLKDEGEVLTVIFQSKKAIKSLDSQTEYVKNALYGERIKKLDVDNTNKNMQMMVKYAISNNLTFIDF